jgi:hypothetical protein
MSFLVHSLLKHSSFLVLDQFIKNLVRNTTEVGLDPKTTKEKGMRIKLMVGDRFPLSMY